MTPSTHQVSYFGDIRGRQCKEQLTKNTNNELRNKKDLLNHVRISRLLVFWVQSYVGSDTGCIIFVPLAQAEQPSRNPWDEE